MASADRVSIADYLAAELVSRDKHEYHDGEVLAMSGGTPRHALLGARLAGVLSRAAGDGPCQAYSGSLNVAIDASRRFVYPDATIVCGELEHHPEDVKGLAISNPRVVFEVLSESTAAYDRGEKFEHYLKIPSLQEVVLLEQDRPYVQSFLRQGDGTWNLRAWEGRDAVARVRAVGFELPLAEVYPPPVPPAAG